MHEYFKREAKEILTELAKTFPIVAITGPRQAGKTTLAQQTFPSKPCRSLEDPDMREAAQTDPRGFLNSFAEGAVLDEVQRAPQLFSYLQGVVDRIAIEIKSGQTLNQSFFRGLDYWRNLDPDENRKTVLIFGGDDSTGNQSGHGIVNWRNLPMALV